MEKKKREIWPIGIAMAMIGFIAGIVVAVSIMMRADVSLTSEDYYAKEIAYQSQLDQSKRGLSAQDKPEIKMLRATQAMEITFPGKKEASSFEGKVTFYRPSNPSSDFSTTLETDENGLFWMSLQGKEKGLWIVKLEWKKDETPFYFEQQLML